MWPRRRRKDTFVPFVRQPYTYRYDPTIYPLPQQWRTRSDADEIFLLPVEFILRFADRDYLGRVGRVDHLKNAFLARSMVVEGILDPLLMILDPYGKLRFHDGYHRLCVAIERPDLFPAVPVKLERSSGRIRGYGRPLYEEVDFLLAWVSRWRP